MLNLCVSNYQLPLNFQLKVNPFWIYLWTVLVHILFSIYSTGSYIDSSSSYSVLVLILFQFLCEQSQVLHYLPYIILLRMDSPSSYTIFHVLFQFLYYLSTLYDESEKHLSSSKSRLKSVFSNCYTHCLTFPLPFLQYFFRELVMPLELNVLSHSTNKL